MPKSSFLCFILVLFFSPLPGHASAPADSLIKSQKKDSTFVSFFYHDFEKFGLLNLKSNDTALAGFQNYDLLYRKDHFAASLGNLGQNYRNLTLPLSPPQSGFDYGIHTSDAYLYQNDSIRYYKVYKTFTELTYTQGAKKEQNFRAVFSRNIYKSLNLGFDFRVASSPGAYQRQKTNDINFVLTTQFFTKNKRYGVIANFLFNRLRNYENGGIKYDSLFEQNIETNRSVISVNLQQAQNRVKESGFYMKHYFDLTRHLKNEKDSASLHRKNPELGRITYSFHYNRQIQNYIDGQPKSGFYPHIYLDTLQTRDSIAVMKISNEIFWSNPSFDKEKKYRVIQLEAGIRQQYIEVSFHALKYYFVQFIPAANFSFQPFPSLRLEAHGDYVFGDYNEGDRSLKVMLSTMLGKTNKNFGIISLYGNYSLQKPAWFYSHFLGNNYKWDTVWRQQGLISGGFNYKWKFLDAGFNISRISNYVYLDSSANPNQFRDQFGYILAYLNGDIDIGRFKFKAQLAYQTIQGTTVLHLPAFLGSFSTYYSQPLFKGAALLQPGLSFFYNTSYYADNYMPATRSFYLQDTREIGNYLYMDVFINLKIQRARFFIMYSHFNASFMGRTYYMVPNYPMQDGAFKFGVTWRFHD